MTRPRALTFLSVLPVYFVLATALGFVDYHVRPFPERGFAEYSPGVVAGTEEPPGKYRILAPYAYVGMQKATGLEPRDAWVIFRWLCLFGGLLATHFYLRTWVDQAGALAGTALAALLLLLTMTNGWAHPDHFVEFALFTWACAEIARGRYGMLALALALNALNRETAVFLLPLVALAGPLDRRRIVWTAILAAIWLGIYLGLRRWLGFVAYDPWQLGRNLEFLKLLPPPRDLYYRAYAWFWLPILLPGVWLAARTWASQPRFARVAIGVVVPIYFVVAALFSSVIESRIFTIFIPLTLPAIVFGVRPGSHRGQAGVYRRGLIAFLRLPAERLTATRATYTGLFLTALATLMYEILLTRIFSVTMWYHFAFVAISVAMFGMTAGALLVYLRPRTFAEGLTFPRLAQLATAFAIVMVLSFLTQLSVPFLVHPSVVAAYAIAFTIAVIAAPFVVGGMVVSLALTRFPAQVGRLYAVDLAGAAIGCVLLVGLLRITDGPTAVIAVAALAAAGGVAFAKDAGSRAIRNTAWATLIVLATGAAVHTAFVWRGFPVFRILYIKGALEARPLFEKWNSYSRVRVNGNPSKPEEPYGWGLSTAWPHDRQVRQLKMDIDVSAGTVMTGYDGDLAPLEHLKFDVTNAGYYVRPGPSVAVIGVGGGRDVLSALTFGASRVTAIEINNDIVRTVNGRFGDFTGHLDRDPRVRFVNDEARSWLARQDERFDVIQISLIDTWAATAAGAFVMSENALYTTDAWRIFLSRLTDTGVLSVSRWYFQERPGEIYRLVALASESLHRAGIANPRAHLMLIRNIREEREGGQPEGVGTLLVGRAPFTADDVAKLRAITGPMRFEVVLAPDGTADPVLASLTSGEDVGTFASKFPINIAPPSDDSPFFFQMFRLRDFADIALLRAGKNSYNMQAVFVLGMLMVTVTALAVVCLLLPRWLTATRYEAAGAGTLVTFFAAIGLGFMLIETSQMQRLITVLGHPSYGLSVVLFSLLLAGGLGSYLTAPLTAGNYHPLGIRRLGTLVVLLIAFGLATPWLGRLSEGAVTPVRILVAGIVLFVPGVFMGMAFPLGIRLAADRPRLLPWLWGVNGATSVCASVLAVGIALTWSISAAFWAGCVCYLVALIAFARTRATQAAA